MTRTSFLTRLFGSIALGRLPVELTKEFRKIYLLQCFVAGFRHYEGMQLISAMQEGDLLELKREPKNEFDDCAIALHLQGKKIGFIPASVNEMLSYLLDAEALSLFAVITHLEKNAQPWENVAVAIYFVQEVNNELPAHASYLTRIEAPHYRTLQYNTTKHNSSKKLPLEDFYNSNKRVINIDSIPAEQKEAKDFFEKYYSTHPIALQKPGRYAQVHDEGIYSFMNVISDNTVAVHTTKEEDYTEFFLENK